ncbi:hypothetical protein AVEN_14949-1 [Araneus ventricosus]|uniref:Endonuclease/exonuclease/phosphatase domain-containing protein n=1 Tax=Araneus ventricosus TaxID=182803 RepID=A0A4Y2FC73_ARAVE|nr:hypothetical protein AVEN_14949-1 [Araneus ventricosus]
MKYSESSFLIDQEFDIDKDVPIIIMGDFNIDAGRNEKAFDFLKHNFNLNMVPRNYPSTLEGNLSTHSRVYSIDDARSSHPTKEEMSLKPEVCVWSSVKCALQNFPVYENPDAVSMVKKVECIFNQTMNSEKCISIQKLFQRKEN